MKIRPAISIDSETGRKVPTREVGRDTKGTFRQAGAIALAMLDEIKRKRMR